MNKATLPNAQETHPLELLTKYAWIEQNKLFLATHK